MISKGERLTGATESQFKAAAEFLSPHMSQREKYTRTLLIRGGNVDFIAKISGLNGGIIEKIKSNAPQLLEVFVSHQEPSVEAGAESKKKGKLQQNAFKTAVKINLVRELLMAGFIGDVHNWVKLQSFYRGNERKPSWIDMLSLEAFLSARKALKDGDLEKMRKYAEIEDRLTIGSENLEREKEFVVSALEKNEIYSDYTARFSEDEHGFYRFDKEGYKCRPVEMKDGCLIFDGFQELDRRTGIRMINRQQSRTLRPPTNIRS